jgi:Malectin domain
LNRSILETHNLNSCSLTTTTTTTTTWTLLLAGNQKRKMSKFSSTLPIISLLLLVIGVRSQVVPTSLYIDCGNPNNSTNSFKNITWMNDGFYAVQTGSVATVIKAPEVKQQTIMQKILGIKPKSPKPIPKPYNTYRSGKIIAYHIPVAKTPTKYNVTLYFYEPK